MAGITKYGFKRKQYSEIENELFLSAKEKFGEDIKLSEKSFLGMFLRLVAWSLSLIWQLAEDIYHQMNYRHAEGVNLDYIVERAAISRFPKTKAKGKLVITGEKGKQIYSGFRAKSEDGREYQTLTSAIIGESQSVKIEAESLLYGSSQNIESGKVTIVSYPEAGIRAISNEKFAGGRDEETDDELRDRFEKTSGAKGKSNVDGIENSVRNIPTVQSVLVEVNETDVAQNGIPPHGIRVIVSGAEGQDEAVAKAILDSKAAGIPTAGDTICQIKDNRDRTRIIKFQRAIDVTIYISVKIGFKPEKMADKERAKKAIKDIVIQHIRGLKAGEKVIVSKILAIVMEFDFVQDAEVKIGKIASALSGENIAISEREVAKTDSEKVSVLDEL